MLMNIIKVGDLVRRKLSRRNAFWTACAPGDPNGTYEVTEMTSAGIRIKGSTTRFASETFEVVCLHTLKKLTEVETYAHFGYAKEYGYK